MTIMPININTGIPDAEKIDITDFLNQQNPTGPSIPTVEPVPYEMEVVPYTVEQPVVVPSLDGNSYINLENIFAQDYRNKRLTKEQILADNRFMDLIRSNLEARYTPGGLLTKARRGAVGLAGGDIGGLKGRDYRKMSDEDVFEIWQNYQRSFSAGQTVTVGNEIAYTMNANDDTKVKLGAGYKLFDQMTNAFTGAGSWPEMADATWDYAKAGVYDPATILGFGIGKLFGLGATKTSAVAAKTLMKEAYKKAIKEGTTKQLAYKTIGNTVKQALPFAFIDTTIAVGVDALSQMQLMDVDVQDEFNPAQSAITAAGNMLVIPTLVAMGATAKELRKGPLKNTFLSYRQFDEDFLTLGTSKAEQLLKKRVKKSTITNYVDENFGLIKGDRKNFLEWKVLRDNAKKRIKARGEQYDSNEITNAFFQYFWLGSPDQKTKGFFQALEDSGFVVHPAMVKKYGTRTAVYANAIMEYLDTKQVKEIVKKFEQDTGRKLMFTDIKNEKRIIDGVETNVNVSYPVSGDKITAKSMGYHFAKSVSEAGEALWLPSELSRLEKAGVNIKDALEMIAGQTKKGPTSKEVRQFGLSVYKRLLTSHLSTTGANIKGFVALVNLNTMADFVTGGINLAQSGAYYGMLDAKKGEEFYNNAYGSVFGALRRGFDVISPDMPIAYADKILELDPKIKSRLFRDVAGDGGVTDSFEHFNLDKGNIILSSTGKIIDAATKGAQTLTFVRLQDDITKRWAFGTNVNQYIMREYGVSPDQFYARKDVSLEMASKKFQEKVVDRALFRTMRETASVNWSTLPAGNAFRAAAKQIENFTNNTELGYIVPFGSFMNTTVATMGDLTAFNAFRATYRAITGKKPDYADPEFAEAWGKASVGLAAIALGIPAAKERIAEGLSYSQERNEEVLQIGPYKIGSGQGIGDIEDKTYDWPVSTIRLLSQMLAHGMQNTNNIKEIDISEIPKDLIDEAVLQTGGQAVRDLDFTGRQVKYVVNKLKNGDIEPLKNLIGGAGERIIAGATRPFDTPNQVIGMFTDANMNPNLREGLFLQGEAVRYINNIPKLFGEKGMSEDLPLKATPFRGTQLSKADPGKNLFGVRTVNEPNLMERMVNIAGMRYWDVFKTDAPNKIQNRMNQIASPFFEDRAIEALKANPDFVNLRKPTQVDIIMDISKKVKEDVINLMEKSLPKEINIIRLLFNKDKEKVKEVMEFLDIEGELIDLLDKPDGLKQLRTIEHMLKNYDTYQPHKTFK